MTIDVLPPLAVNTGWLKVLTEAGIKITYSRAYGPMGLNVSIIGPGGHRGSIVLTQSDAARLGDPTEWLHASISWTDFMPTYADLQLLHRAVFGRRRYAYQVFAPAAQHVSGEGIGIFGHKYALHLWGRVDGEPAIPEFGSYFGTV